MVVFDKAEELIDYTITITDNYKYFAKKRRFTLFLKEMVKWHNLLAI